MFPWWFFDKFYHILHSIPTAWWTGSLRPIRKPSKGRSTNPKQRTSRSFLQRVLHAEGCAGDSSPRLANASIPGQLSSHTGGKNVTRNFIINYRGLQVIFYFSRKAEWIGGRLIKEVLSTCSLPSRVKWEMHAFITKMSDVAHSPYWHWNWE